MPEDKLADVAKPDNVGAGPTSRPIIVNTAPRATDTTLASTPSATKIPVTDQSFEAFPAATPTVVAPQPAATLSETPAMPPPQPPAEPAATVASPPVPQFGELQNKVDAHPLFSGVSTPPPKNRRKLLKRTLWPLLSVIVTAIIFFMLIDAGIIRGGSHLPFHILKQPAAATTPVITTQPTTVSAATPVDPYAGWKSFSTQYQKMTFKYPSDWQLTDATSTNTNKNDMLTLKSSNGFSITFQALVPTGAASLETTLVSNEPISFTAQSDYLLYYSADATKNKTTTGPVSSAIVSTSATKLSMPLAHSSDGSIWDITLTPAAPIQLTSLAGNTDLQKAKLILESATY